MSHHEENIQLSPEEIMFNDCIRRGDDLANIHQYTPAKECYNQALEVHFNDNLAQEKINSIKNLQKYEQKTILKILAVAVVIIAAVWIFKTRF